MTGVRAKNATIMTVDTRVTKMISMERKDLSAGVGAAEVVASKCEPSFDGDPS